MIVSELSGEDNVMSNQVKKMIIYENYLRKKYQNKAHNFQIHLSDAC